MRQLPVFACDDMAACALATVAVHSPSGIVMECAKIMDQLFACGERAKGDKVVTLVKPDVRVATVIHIPLDRKAIQVAVSRQPACSRRVSAVGVNLPSCYRIGPSNYSERDKYFGEVTCWDDNVALAERSRGK